MKRLNPIVFIAATVFVCSCVIPPNGGRVNIQQDILSVYVDNTKDFVNFTDDFRFPGGSKNIVPKRQKNSIIQNCQNLWNGDWECGRAMSWTFPISANSAG